MNKLSKKPNKLIQKNYSKFFKVEYLINKFDANKQFKKKNNNNNNESDQESFWKIKIIAQVL